MRLAVISDIHGNLTALEAVLRDLRETAPDLVLHGGDLADGGSSPVEIVDRVRGLGWRGVMGNTDEMLVSPEVLTERLPAEPALHAVSAMARWSRERLGEERLEWLRSLPAAQRVEGVVLVHASPGNLWSAPGASAADAEMARVYGQLGGAPAVYGHVHLPFIRAGVANPGSVGLPYDGDRRASYLIVDGGQPWVRRVEYAVDAEIARLRESGIPHAEWVERQLAAAAPCMPY